MTRVTKIWPVVVAIGVYTTSSHAAMLAKYDIFIGLNSMTNALLLLKASWPVTFSFYNIIARHVYGILPFAILDTLGIQMFPYSHQNAAIFPSSDHVGAVHNAFSVRCRYVHI